jgi:Domain of unknown function (DUF4345)
MKRMLLQIILGIGGLLMVFRFGLPAFLSGTTGPGPFGNPWVAPGQATTLLLDADLRFFGAMMIGIGMVFFGAIWRLEVWGSIIYVLAAAVALGATGRIYARIRYGDPGTAGTIPITLEVLIPIFLVLLRYSVGRDATRTAHR